MLSASFKNTIENRVLKQFYLRLWKISARNVISVGIFITTIPRVARPCFPSTTQRKTGGEGISAACSFRAGKSRSNAQIGFLDF
jgi:hypothetical protein